MRFRRRPRRKSPRPAARRPSYRERWAVVTAGTAKLLRRNLAVIVPVVYHPLEDLSC
jgi:hypothetical protein